MGAITRVDSADKVRLASEPPLVVGQLHVDPSTRQVRNGERQETLEPRVMQVLVALARSNGRVVSRDELIESCWDGRAVSEDAIHRVLSRLRQVAGDIGGQTLRIETIRGVGYRLEDGAQHGAAQRPLSRRSFMSISAAVAAAAGAGAWFLLRGRHEPLPLAAQYYQRGIETRGQASLEQAERGTAFFREAVRIDPQFADAWGALAWNYRGMLEFGPRPDPDRWQSLCRSAAARALELDPENSDAQAALLLLKPFFRNWLEIERGLRRLIGRHPRNSILEYNLAYTLADVGRWRDSVPYLRAVTQRERFWPLPLADLAIALFATGREQESEDLVDDGMKRFPGRIDFWLVKGRSLMLDGRYSEALAFVNDPANRPANSFEPITAFQITILKALADGSRAARDAAQTQVYEMLRRQPAFIHAAAVSSAMLGNVDASYALLEGLYLGRGRWAAYRQARPMTAALFGPPAAALRSDPRFPQLLREIGLEDYWRLSGMLPDFRRYR